MPGILINKCKQGRSSFNPVLGSVADLSVCWGDDRVTRHHNLGTETGGALHVSSEHPEEVVLGCSACAVTSGGILEDASFQRIANEFLGGSLTNSSKGQPAAERGCAERRQRESQEPRPHALHATIFLLDENGTIPPKVRIFRRIVNDNP